MFHAIKKVIRKHHLFVSNLFHSGNCLRSKLHYIAPSGVINTPIVKVRFSSIVHPVVS